MYVVGFGETALEMFEAKACLHFAKSLLFLRLKNKHRQININAQTLDYGAKLVPKATPGAPHKETNIHRKLSQNYR